MAEAHLDAAIAAIEQLLALVPPGADAVPLSACWTVRSLEVYGDDPTRFERATLIARRDALKKATYAIIRRAGELADPAFHARNRALMETLMTGLKTPEDPDHRARREAHERKQELLGQVYYVQIGKRPRVARSLAEMVLATELSACGSCRQAALRDITVTGSGVTWTARAVCGACGTPATHRYSTKADLVTPAPDELGPGPSFQIMKADLYAELERVRPRVATDPAARARARLCLAELSKLTVDPECSKFEAELATLRAMDSVSPTSAFARVLAAPGSEAARRALLDEWRSAGDPRAALLADQLALRAHRLGGTLGTPDAQALYRRVNLAVARASRPLPRELAGWVTAVEYRRGLVAGVTLPGERFAAAAPTVFAVAPVQHVTLTGPLGDLGRLFATPGLERLVSLNIHGLGAAFGDAGAQALAASPHVGGLRWLALTDDDIGERGVDALAASPHLKTLRYLCLSGNRVDPTPYASAYEGVTTTGRPPLAVALEQRHGPRAWLMEPTDAESWPPERDELGIDHPDGNP